MNTKAYINLITILFFSAITSQALSLNLFDGKWYGANPCAYFDESQDEMHQPRARVELRFKPQ